MSVYNVKKLKKPIDALITVPGSKSITNRALILAALSIGRCEIKGALFSDDTVAFISSLKSMGFDTDIKDNKNIVIKGTGGRLPLKTGVINVGSAGTAARFLTAFLAMSDGIYTVECTEQMANRPMKPLFDALEELGAKIDCFNKKDHLPARITGKTIADNLSSELLTEEGNIETTVPSDISTQFLSALLMVAPIVANRYNQNFVINVTGNRARGAYVMMTLKMMHQFGVTVKCEESRYVISPGNMYERHEYTVEPDASSAGYFYAAAAVGGGSIKVKGIHRESLQGDVKLIDVLCEMGCTAKDEQDGILLTSPANGKLNGIDINMKDFSDQTMTVAAIAPYCESEVIIRGVSHIRNQESDRIAGVTNELNKLGVKAEETYDGIRITPGKVSSGTVDTYDDHRMAMAFTLTGLVTDGIVIDNPECSRKTYGDFFKDIESIYK